MSFGSVWFGVLVVAVSALAAVPAAQGQTELPLEESYVCPPCACSLDGKLFEEAGDCPECGMTLRKQSLVKRVAILIFDGVQIIDYTGPFEVFGQAGWDVFTVAPTEGTIVTTMGMSVNPKYGFESCPEIDILLVPGGHVHDLQQSETAMDWIRAKAEEAEHVLSVCNGAFLIAEAGLLDGKTATTFYGLIDQLEEDFPQVNVVRDQRYTDNGKVLCSAGLSSGIDASLYLVSKYRGTGAAQTLALHMEYEWDPQSTFARASLADRYLPSRAVFEGMEIQSESTIGDRDHWEIAVRITTEESAPQLAKTLAERIAADGRWKLAHAGMGTSLGEWERLDPEGNEWTGTGTVHAATGGGNQYTATFRIQRKDVKLSGSTD